MFCAGVVSLSSCHSPGQDLPGAHVFLAYPGDKAGSVFVYDALNLVCMSHNPNRELGLTFMQRAVTVIEAHSSQVTCLALSNKGDKLATASEKVEAEKFPFDADKNSPGHSVQGILLSRGRKIVRIPERFQDQCCYLQHVIQRRARYCD